MPSVSARASYNVFDNPLTINAPVPSMPPVEKLLSVKTGHFFSSPPPKLLSFAPNSSNLYAFEASGQLYY